MSWLELLAVNGIVGVFVFCWLFVLIGNSFKTYIIKEEGKPETNLYKWYLDDLLFSGPEGIVRVVKILWLVLSCLFMWEIAYPIIYLYSKRYLNKFLDWYEEEKK